MKTVSLRLTSNTQGISSVDNKNGPKKLIGCNLELTTMHKTAEQASSMDSKTLGT